LALRLTAVVLVVRAHLLLEHATADQVVDLAAHRFRTVARQRPVRATTAAAGLTLAEWSVLAAAVAQAAQAATARQLLAALAATAPQAALADHR
jgi:hypothetical protein